MTVTFLSLERMREAFRGTVIQIRTGEKMMVICAEITSYVKVVIGFVISSLFLWQGQSSWL